LNPPYGISDAASWQAGFQLNHTIPNFFGRRNVLTIGSEYLTDRIHDNIPRYNYLIRQQTKDWGSFFQSDWDFAEGFTLLSGLRIDYHNLLDHAVISPRIALLYGGVRNTQFRLSYGTGFRAPQAFDTDLHIAFAGGGVSRVRLDPQLSEEQSQSWSGSVNYDKAVEKWVAGFTVEGFYTRLQNAFVLEHQGSDAFGEVFEKSNGRVAAVKGITLELRGNYNSRWQMEAGYTLQRSSFGEAVEYFQGLPPERIFLRTPNSYGYLTLTHNPNKKWSFNTNAVYTGSMQVPHIGGAENNPTDRLIQTPPFIEMNVRIARNFTLPKWKSKLEIYTGCKNLFNAYQEDFDLGKNRDSNFMYGPNMPRTFFIGFSLRSE
jgi:outer membrane receptor for ferrienterochelin and colicins